MDDLRTHFFDCDSTLSAIEGIDELARMTGKEQREYVFDRLSAQLIFSHGNDANPEKAKC